MESSAPTHPDVWRDGHLGQWLRLALERFDGRVMALMVSHPLVPLGLGNLAARGQVGAAHIHITRHLPVDGARLTDLAGRAGMTKQAMAGLVAQCEAWGMVQREGDLRDGRARRIVFTPLGRGWLAAYEDCVRAATQELRDAIGAEVATVVALGLEAYASQS